jgi:tetratricopeptide (TPR) repeat protein
VAFHIGKAYLELDQPDKGLAYLSNAESLNSNTANVYRLMGRCHARLGDQDQAVTAYTQALRINPNDAESLSDLGRQYDLRNENLEIALLFCKRSTQIDPKNGRFHHRLGRLYLKAEKLPRALEAFEKAAALGYDSQTAIDEINAMLADNAGETSNM